jgi:hypothetical protein
MAWHVIKVVDNLRSNFSNLVKIGHDEFYFQPSIAYIVGSVKHNKQKVHIIPSEIY